MDTDNVRPTTIEGIKRLAKRLAKAEGIQHSAALERAAQAAGFGNFRAARAMLGVGGKQLRADLDRAERQARS